MTIRTESVSDQEVAIILDKQFDFNCVEDFRRAYEHPDRANKKQYTIDFKFTQYIDSSALGMLINLQKKVAESGGKVRLTNPSDQVKKLYAISRFDKKFDIQ